DVDVDRQLVLNPGGTMRSGYNASKAGPNPWTPTDDIRYIVGTPGKDYGEHAYPDSANTATAMTTGVRTYNNAINVDATGGQVATIAHVAQDHGYAVGAVSSVPVTHATPAATYAHNVSRNDYQDLARDMLGLPSIAHPDQPLPGLDVVIGGGFGALNDEPRSKQQGENFLPGLNYIATESIDAANVAQGGKYTVVMRTPGENGQQKLADAARQAVESGTRLLGLYGVGEYGGHLPFRTADGDYQPAPGNRGIAEVYTEADLQENPTLAEMTSAALTVLQTNPKGFWLMVEAGDVDWANHDNNLDTSIGAVKSGDDAVKVITDWVEQHSNWQESVLIVTADHGHYLNLLKPEALTPPASE
ncbi:MAG: alkaline phosphatase, partial [Planctomycetaceae bacterium]|nr:alkaline phosphatase [Planctomycetaceae bacterium]